VKKAFTCSLRFSEKATTCSSNSLHDCMVGSAHTFLFFCQGDLFLCLLLVISRRWSAKISYYLLFAKKICDVYAAPSLYKQVFGIYSSTEPVIRFSRGLPLLFHQKKIQ
jgi:hypothetical protein